MWYSHQFAGTFLFLFLAVKFMIGILDIWWFDDWWLLIINVTLLGMSSCGVSMADICTFVAGVMKIQQ